LIFELLTSIKALKNKKKDESGDDVDSLRKDWHNYAQIAEEKQRIGPGEQGMGVTLDAKDIKSPDRSNLYSANGFNALVSDKISLQRAINDIRHPK
jgi:polypeptide N-acetylgalactosaminyltransferase